MSNQEKPPIRIKPCERCGKLVDEAAPCWVCNYPGQPFAGTVHYKSSPLRVLFAVLMWMGVVMAVGIAGVIALFVACIYVLSGGR